MILKRWRFSLMSSTSVATLVSVWVANQRIEAQRKWLEKKR